MTIIRTPLRTVGGGGATDPPATCERRGAGCCFMLAAVDCRKCMATDGSAGSAL